MLSWPFNKLSITPKTCQFKGTLWVSTVISYDRMISTIDSCWILSKWTQNRLGHFENDSFSCQPTLRDDFNVWPASLRTSNDVFWLAAKTERQMPSQVKLCTAFGTIPNGNWKRFGKIIFNKQDFMNSYYIIRNIHAMILLFKWTPSIVEITSE